MLHLSRQAQGSAEARTRRATPAQRPDIAKPSPLNQLIRPSYRRLRDLKDGLDVPVLALNGELDLQVPAQVNLDAIATALEAGGNPDFTIRELPGLNHLFQEATTGSPNEYARIDQTVSPIVLGLMAAWILERFGD